jgi:hypothetical protein
MHGAEVQVTGAAREGCLLARRKKMYKRIYNSFLIEMMFDGDSGPKKYGLRMGTRTLNTITYVLMLSEGKFLSMQSRTGRGENGKHPKQWVWHLLIILVIFL